MPRPLSPRENRLAALLLLASALALAYWAGIYVWFVAPHQAIDEQMADVREAQRRYAALQRQREPLLVQLDTARSTDAGRESLLPGDDPSTVAASLMQHAADIIGQHGNDGAGCELLNRTPIADTPGDGPYAQVKVSFNLSCSIEPLEAILYALETDRPFLFVTQLRVEGHKDGAPHIGPGRMDVQLLVTGYMLRAIRSEPADTEDHS